MVALPMKCKVRFGWCLCRSGNLVEPFECNVKCGGFLGYRRQGTRATVAGESLASMRVWNDFAAMVWGRRQLWGLFAPDKTTRPGMGKGVEDRRMEGKDSMFKRR